jgi:hypothetical protein
MVNFNPLSFFFTISADDVPLVALFVFSVKAAISELFVFSPSI